MKALFFFLFAISGFSGLIYESIWSHYLKLFLGHAAYAQTLVLAIFMGGMAIGSWLCSRYSSRWKNLLLGYAIAEGIIGILALIFHESFDTLIHIAYNSVMPAIGEPLLVNIFKWSLATLIILPQSILLGMTFPLMSAGIIRWFPNSPGSSIAMLYFSNSIGAAIGVLVSGFVLIAWVGLPGTIRTAGFINISLALTVWWLVRNRPQPNPITTANHKPPAEHSGPQWYWVLLLVSFFTGMASFVYEISWIRMLSLVLGSSTHAFELMLSAFIFGLAFGGLWIRQRISRIKNVVQFLAIVQLIMGVLALSTLPLYGNTFEIMQWLLQILNKDSNGYFLFNISSHGLALAIMLPTTFCAGMTLPLITHTLISFGSGEKSIGAVYAANTVGAIIGVFFAVHIGLPLLGLKGALLSGAAIDIGLALLLLFYAKPKTISKPLTVSGAIGLSALAITLLLVELNPYKMASGVYRTGKLLTAENTEILFHKDGKAATVDLHRERDGSVNIRTNGKVDANINMTPGGNTSLDEPTMVLAAAIPLAFNPQIKNAAVIGMGSGLTTHTLLATPSITRVDTVEIEPAMVEAAQGFRPRVELAYTDPRSHIHIDDAKTYFSTHNKKYDVIISEPSNPWVSGTASLFTNEFYELMPNYLSEQGILVQWMQLYELNLELIASVIKALKPHFNDYAIYTATDTDILIIAKRQGLLRRPSDAIFSYPQLQNELSKIFIQNETDLELRRLGTKSSLQPLFESYTISANSDYYPVLDLGAAKTRFLQVNATELVGLGYVNIPALKILDPYALKNQNTSITQYHTPSKTMFTMIATSIRDVYLNSGGKAAFLPQKFRQNIEQMNNIFIRCDRSASANWLDTLLTFSAATVPFLSSEELNQIWSYFKGTSCYKRLIPQQKDWVELMHSLSVHKAENIAGIGEWLLRHSVGNKPEHFEFLIANALLGELMSGKQEQAQQIWQRYQQKYNFDNKENLLLRLLTAHNQIN
ncbi:fused MFS/spermidine synthase [Kaarinaea lacus]